MILVANKMKSTVYANCRLQNFVRNQFWHEIGDANNEPGRVALWPPFQYIRKFAAQRKDLFGVPINNLSNFRQNETRGRRE